MERIIIRDEYITLGQLLKLSGTAQTGGQAKFMIADGRVRVNGQVVLKRGRKVFPGDVVSIDGQDILEMMSKE
jgi:ribosome-associated protein